MSDDRNLGVTEVRLGLTLLTCLLVALGYVVLQRLGGSQASSPADITPVPLSASPHTAGNGPSGGVVQPQILPVQGHQPLPERFPHTSQRPLWLAPQQGADDAKPPAHDATAPERL